MAAAFDPNRQTQIQNQGAILAVGPTGVVDIASGGKFKAAGTQAAAIAATTDNTGGAVSDTLASISDSATANAIASVNAKQTAIVLALHNLGIIG